MLRERKKQEKREEKARRKAERKEAKRLRAEAIERGEDPDAVAPLLDGSEDGVSPEEAVEQPSE